MFICNHCPYVKAVREKIVRDTTELSALGISSVAIMPNDTLSYPDDSLDNMKRVALHFAFPFPYLIDESQETARAYGAIRSNRFMDASPMCVISRTYKTLAKMGSGTIN